MPGWELQVLPLLWVWAAFMSSLCPAFASYSPKTEYVGMCVCVPCDGLALDPRYSPVCPILFGTGFSQAYVPWLCGLNSLCGPSVVILQGAWHYVCLRP